jgi:energy-coupling factor transport system substrate-specific component
MEKSKKINAKDLINVGIYTALYLVMYFVLGMLNAIPIFYPILLVLSPIVTAIPFMLFLTKVKKPGMVFIMSLILGVFWFMMGYTWLPVVSYIIFGLIAEIIFKKGEYKNFKLITIGYWMFSCGSLGCQAPIWLMTDSYMVYVRDYMGEQYANQLAHYMPSWMGIAAFGLVLIGAVIGASLGKKMLKKHFERAGIV